jgi:hypothetical protein
MMSVAFNRLFAFVGQRYAFVVQEYCFSANWPSFNGFWPLMHHNRGKVTGKAVPNLISGKPV